MFLCVCANAHVHTRVQLLKLHYAIGGQQTSSDPGEMAARLHDQDSPAGVTEAHDTQGQHEAASATWGKLVLNTTSGQYRYLAMQMYSTVWFISPKILHRIVFLYSPPQYVVGGTWLSVICLWHLILSVVSYNFKYNHKENHLFELISRNRLLRKKL